MAMYNTTTREEFEEKVIKNTKVVLVDFWAQWCPPCRAMAPILDMASRHLENEVDIVKIDVEASADNNHLATEYYVSGIPNMKIFKDGKMVKEIVGMRPLVALEGELRSVVDSE